MNHHARERAQRIATEYLTRALYGVMEPHPDGYAAAMVYAGLAIFEIAKLGGARSCEQALAYIRESTRAE